MILSTMTYEDIYREIKNDFQDVFNHYIKTFRPKVCKMAQKSSIYPWRKFDYYTHPSSRNKYVYFSIVNKHSSWAEPAVVMFCEFEGKFGKEIITIAKGKEQITFRPALIINVFQAHFFKRYYERFIKDEQIEYNKIAIFLARNSYSLPLSSEAVSANELLKDEPGYFKTAMLTLDGVELGLQSKENRNIYIYKTFVPFDEMFQKQYEKVLPEYMTMLVNRGCADYPQCKETIKKVYSDAAKEIRDLVLGDNQMSTEDHNRAYMLAYSKACQELFKYIIL